MYGIPDSVKPLSAAEEQVMLAVWACRAPVTRRDIDAKLRAKGWAPATVLNFLYRLEKKGWVKSGKDGNRNTYTPAITRRAYNVWSMRERLDTLFGGDLVNPFFTWSVSVNTAVQLPSLPVPAVVAMSRMGRACPPCLRP